MYCVSESSEDVEVSLRISQVECGLELIRLVDLNLRRCRHLHLLRASKRDGSQVEVE